MRNKQRKELRDQIERANREGTPSPVPTFNRAPSYIDEFHVIRELVSMSERARQQENIKLSNIIMRCINLITDSDCYKDFNLKKLKH